MSTPTTPPNPDDELPSDAEFDAWMRAHPENADHFFELIARMQSGEFGELPEEVRELGATTLAKVKVAERVKGVHRAMRDLVTDLDKVLEGRPTNETVHTLSARCDTLIDSVLDVPEPHRTTIMSELVPLRDSLREVSKLES